MKSNITARDTRILILVIVFCLIVPFILNWILQKEAFVPVIGNEVTWLSFWGTYIGAILTALMVLGTFITIRKTTNTNRIQWRIDWLNSFRTAAAEIIVATDDTTVGQLSQDVVFGRYEKAVDAGHLMETAVKKSYFVLSSVLQEYDDVFEKADGEDFVRTLSGYIEPFLHKTGEIFQFAIICKYLADKGKDGLFREGLSSVMQMKKTMDDLNYHEISKAIQDLADGLLFEDVVHDAIVQMQRNCASIDLDELRSFLMKLAKQNATRTYGFSFMAVSRNGSK